MVDRGHPDAALMALARAIIAGDAVAVSATLAASPELVRARIRGGAPRRSSNPYFLVAIRHYLYAGDTALHVAAAAYRQSIAMELLAKGADICAQNRRGAQPLHYAADGAPGCTHWDPVAQAATVACLLDAGADPNALDKSGVAPVHRAVRTRSAAAVKALLDGGADAHLTNRKGSRPWLLATWNTGRSGSGSAEAKEQQAEIVRLLREHGAAET
jgi:hypothetical protein